MTDVNNNSSSTERPRVSRLFGQKVVKQQFQLGFSLTLFGLMAMTAAVMWGYGRLIMNNLVNNGLIQQKDLINHLHVLNSALLVTGVLGFLVTYVVSILYSHRIAGPLYQFERVLHMMKIGNFSTRIHLRRFDELKDMAHLLNETNEYLSKNRDSVNGLNEEIIQILEKIKSESKNAGLSEQESLINQLLAKIPRHSHPA